MKSKPGTSLANQSALEAAQIAYFQINKYELALDLFQYIVVYSKKQNERKEAQEKIAEIYYDKLANYKSAIEAYTKILAIENRAEQKRKFQFRIAKSYFYLNNFFQALSEIDLILKQNVPEDEKFEFSLFKANVLLATKKIDESIKIYKGLIEGNPKRALAENVPMSLSVAYEEQNEIDDAIQVLDEVKEVYPNPDFIELKIKRLQMRKSNLPGAQGLKK